MTSTKFRIVQRPREYSKKTREAFCSGAVLLDRYFREKVTQDIRNNLARCFIALDGDRIAGFYTLSASSIALDDLPEGLKKRLRYEFIPAVRIGRLAVDKDFKRQGLGSTLVFDAALRVANSPIGAYAIMVDTKDDAVGFYEKLGFTPIPDEPNTVLLRLGKISQ